MDSGDEDGAEVARDGARESRVEGAYSEGPLRCPDTGG